MGRGSGGGGGWTEIDRDEGVWTVPAPRTEANREHRVALSRRAVDILEEARSIRRGNLSSARRRSLLPLGPVENALASGER